MTSLYDKAYLRAFNYDLELDNLRKLKNRTVYIWGRNMGGLLWVCCMISIQWVRFLSFCAKGGK